MWNLSFLFFDKPCNITFKHSWKKHDIKIFTSATTRFVQCHNGVKLGSQMTLISMIPATVVIRIMLACSFLLGKWAQWCYVQFSVSKRLHALTKQLVPTLQWIKEYALKSCVVMKRIDVPLRKRVRFRNVL